MTLIQNLIEAGGGIWVGTMDCPASRDGQPGYTLLLFNSPKTGSTLALKSSDITADVVAAPELVREHIATSDKLFEENKNG